jgi:hypothetical protein
MARPSRAFERLILFPKFPDKKQVCPAGNFCIVANLSTDGAPLLGNETTRKGICLKNNQFCPNLPGDRRKQNIDAPLQCVTLHS